MNGVVKCCSWKVQYDSTAQALMTWPKEWNRKKEHKRPSHGSKRLTQCAYTDICCYVSWVVHLLSQQDECSGIVGEQFVCSLCAWNL